MIVNFANLYRIKVNKTPAAILKRSSRAHDSGIINGIEKIVLQIYTSCRWHKSISISIGYNINLYFQIRNISSYLNCPKAHPCRKGNVLLSKN